MTCRSTANGSTSHTSHSRPNQSVNSRSAMSGFVVRLWPASATAKRSYTWELVMRVLHCITRAQSSRKPEFVHNDDPSRASRDTTHIANVSQERSARCDTSLLVQWRAHESTVLSG